MIQVRTKGRSWPSQPMASSIDGSEMVPLRLVMEQQARKRRAKLLIRRVVTNQLLFFGGFDMKEDLTPPDGEETQNKKSVPVERSPAPSVPVAALRGETEAADRAEAQATEALRVAREELSPFGVTIDDQGHASVPLDMRRERNGNGQLSDAAERYERYCRFLELYGFQVGEDGSLLPMTTGGKHD